jgi:hypothetical protein
MNKFFKIKSIVGIVIAALFGLVSLFEVSSINENSSEYVRVYNISECSTHWQFQSIDNYKTLNVLHLAISVIYVVLAISFFYTKRPLFKYLLLFIEVVVILWFIRYLSLWIFSGFDHYQGFDPYVL